MQGRVDFFSFFLQYLHMDNDKLVQYITEQQNDGIPLDETIKALYKAGWHEEQITQALHEVHKNKVSALKHQSAYTPPGSTKTVNLTLTGLVLLGMGVSLYSFFSVGLTPNGSTRTRTSTSAQEVITPYEFQSSQSGQLASPSATPR